MVSKTGESIHLENRARGVVKQPASRQCDFVRHEFRRAVVQFN